jgi:nucleoside phosphorylase
MAAACAMLDKRHESLPLQPESHQHNNYVLGRIGPHNVVVACLPSGITGTISAARVVNQMLATFKRLKFGLMVGIGGGAPSAENDIRLGDVVVGKPTGFFGGVIQYDFGKTVQNGRFVRTGMLNKPPEALLTAMSILQARHLMEGHGISSTIQQMIGKYPAMESQFTYPGVTSDKLYEAEYEHPESEPTCSNCDPERLKHREPRPLQLPVIHYGLIASGDQVMKHGATREQLRKELDVLCFEMEAAGLIDSLPFAIIRGISDYADSHKNNRWQGYAAATAAAYAKELMSVIPAAESQDPRPPVDIHETNKVLYADVQEWLSPADVQDDLYRHENECMSGSCDWALNTNEVQSFLTNKTETEILRIGGAPGNGKTTLTGFIIHHLIETTNADVLYFFCRDTDETKNRPLQVLRSLLSQLLSKTEGSDLYSWVNKVRLQSGQKNAQSFATLSHAFQFALGQDLQKPLLYIVVDALDECQDGTLLASSLITASKLSKGVVKLVLSSRENPELLDVFSQYQENRPPLKELVVAPAYVRRPVKAYVQERIYRCKHIGHSALGRIVLREVSAAADGSWLYARLMMDEIQRLPSAASVQRQLENIPNGLVQLHSRIFATMEKSFSPLELRLSQQVFMWVDMLDFVQVGRMHLDREVLDIVFQAENGGEPVFDSMDLARRLCFPLVTFKQLRKASRHSVVFVHQTAAQFVRQCASRRTETGALMTVPRILKPQALKELYRANTSVWYFESCVKSTSILEDLRAKPTTEGMHTIEGMQRHGSYFEMAYGLWGAFFLEELPTILDEEDLEQASMLCNRLALFLQSGRCLKWIEMAIIINYAGRFVNLYDNVNRALQASKRMLSNSNSYETYPFLRKYSMVISEFFVDYAYVICTTGPHGPEEGMVMPDGFESRPLAAELLSLGRNWQHIYS